MAQITSLHQLLEESAAAAPEHMAVIGIDNKSITYAELNAHSNKVREVLSANGISFGDRVGIYLPKSIDVLHSIFGILKSGAAYVPVDPNAPPPRNVSIFKDCAVSAIITNKKIFTALTQILNDQSYSPPVEIGKDILLIKTAVSKTASNSDPEKSPSTSSKELAYILYTSGSTGKPKGVVHTHASALSFIDWCSSTFHPDESDRFSSHAPFHFDLSILDIYLPIKHRATLILVENILGRQPKQLGSFIAEKKISVWYSTPSILRLLVEYGNLDHYDYSALKLVLFAGEVFPIKHLRALKSHWPKPKYFNLYGPTETNVCTYFEIPTEIPVDRFEPYPIGKVCENDEAKVTGALGGPLPPDSEGELCIRGGSLMLDYWRSTERNASSFLKDDQGAKWYPTGDIVKKDPNGDYIYLGRKDRMVKRHGYRVELGEIEAAIYGHPAISEAAVVAHPDDENGVRITAFLCCSDEDKPSLIEFKRFCSEVLPGYMIPDRISFRSSLPKTSTDKIDYESLKESQ